MLQIGFRTIHVQSMTFGKGPWWFMKVSSFILVASSSPKPWKSSAAGQGVFEKDWEHKEILAKIQSPSAWASSNPSDQISECFSNDSEIHIHVGLFKGSFLFQSQSCFSPIEPTRRWPNDSLKNLQFLGLCFCADRHKKNHRRQQYRYLFSKYGAHTCQLPEP